MKKIFVIFIFYLISNQAFAEIGRSTSFDDRDICEKTRGVWREFGNSVGDSCEAKLDQFSIAAQVITYACDCGKGRCWNGEKCTAMQEYKKAFDQRQEIEKSKIAEAKKTRQKEYQKNSHEIIQAMVGKTVSDVKSDNGDLSSNAPQFYDKLLPGGSDVVVTRNTVLNNVNKQTQQLITQGGDAVKQVKEGSLGKIFTTPKSDKPLVQDVTAATTTTNDPAAGPTPFFLQQQEKSKQAAAANSGTVIVDAPGLPQIPLPQ